MSARCISPPTLIRYFHHGNIIKYCHRPFLSDHDKTELSKIGAWHDGIWKGKNASRWRISNEAIEIMNDNLLLEINNTVGENDTLWHLGDFSMAPKSNDQLNGYYYRCKRIREKIKCKNVNIIWGNHDNYCIRDLFNISDNLLTINIHGQRLVLCHYALAIWDKSHRGAMNLYGHSHSEAEVRLSRMMKGRKSMDVGVDNASKILGAYRPFSLEEIESLIGSKPGFAFDHHVSDMMNTPEEHEV